MIGVGLLKLDELLWEDIKQGKKYVEIRKINKDYIQCMYDIEYIGLNTKEYLGKVRCIGKLYKTPLTLLNDGTTKHQPTLDFIEQHYFNEDILIQFTILYEG